ncbi:aldehyde dehydrogenase family protein [Halomonas sp.]|uniref:aldehyde dehydrogenase family protein n=1 Tax=Halomonas sp. TaxID=1486246 RepID=UPI003D0C184C
MFVEPATLTSVKPQMATVSEENFGPFAPLYDSATEGDMFPMVNDAIFSLVAYLYPRTWLHDACVRGLKHGMVDHYAGLISNEAPLFGSVKQLNLGREGAK